MGLREKTILLTVNVVNGGDGASWPGGSVGEADMTGRNEPDGVGPKMLMMRALRLLFCASAPVPMASSVP